MSELKQVAAETGQALEGLAKSLQLFAEKLTESENK